MKKLQLLVLASVLVLLSACKTERSPMTYFMDIDQVTAPIPQGEYAQKIEPGDELFITVNSKNPEATAAYNVMSSNPATKADLTGTTQPRQQTFIVDPEGYIMYPILGKIYVKGMTVNQLRDYILDKIKDEVNDAVVFVEIVSYRVSIGGEVSRPGLYWVTSPRYSILDLISQAGDLTQYGERNNVLLIREENGERKHIRLNLNSADLLSSPYFYLKQNDYVYITPNAVRQDNSEYNQFNSYRLQVVSTIVSGSVGIISLIIALTR